MMKKIAFFDIDGTITSEADGSIPQSATDAIRAARKNGHLMFVNTGRCFQNVETRFKEIGFDGYVCGCGTNIYCEGKEVLYVPQTHEITLKLLKQARKTNVDILFEGRKEVNYDLSRPLSHPQAQELYRIFKERGYQMRTDLEAPDFFCDKFVIWYTHESQLAEFRKVSDLYFTCVDRGGTFREFVPKGYSKATGLHFVLNYYGISPDNAYAFGDSNNDLSMLTCIKNSIAMGNAESDDVLKTVSHVTGKASEGGLSQALKHFGFLS